MNTALWLDRSAVRYATRPALMRGAEGLCDYDGLQAQVAGLAAALAQRGVAPGDRVAIFSPNCPEYLIAFFAIWRAGAVAVPINGKLHAKEVRWIIENAGADLVFASAGFAARDGRAVIDLTGAEFAQMCAVAGGGCGAPRALGSLLAVLHLWHHRAPQRGLHHAWDGAGGLAELSGGCR